MPVNALAFIGPVLILAVIASALLSWPKPGGRIAIAACGGLAALIPIGQTTPAAFLLGTFGPVSAATMVFCGLYLYARIAGRRDRQLPSSAFLLCVVVTGAIFYPLCAGLTSFHPYDLGYRGLALPALMLVYVAIGWIARAPDIPCWVALAALLFLLDAYNSRNLWDYLIFPFDLLAGATYLTIAVRRRRMAGSPHAA